MLSAKLDAMQRIADMRGKLVEVTDRLQQLVNIDGLTGLANRRYLDEIVDREWNRSARNKSPLSFVIFDVDHFKLYNDTYGHTAGDDCLRRLADACRSVLHRSTDVVARYGGEEFAVVLPETPLAGASEVGERIRSAVSALNIDFKHSPGQGHVTVSVGCASLIADPNSSPGVLVEAADRKLYEAKENGRNRICA